MKINHPFEPMIRRGKPEPRWCGAWLPAVSIGVITLRSECGYPPKLHPKSESNPEGWSDED